MNGSLGRVDGGTGVALNEPYLSLEAEVAGSTSVDGPFADLVREGVDQVTDRIGGDPIRIRINDTYPHHVGLGLGTQAALAGGFAASKLNGGDLSIREISEITNRGGTSGIGTAVFRSGGFILDGGHSFEEKGGFLPTSASEASPPPVLSRLDFPDWNIHLILPEGTGLHGSEEVSFFQTHCPIAKDDVEKLSRIILMQLLPSVVEESFSGFRDAILRMNEIGFKKAEIQTQPRSKEIIDTLADRGYATGMSSWGPAVYAISPEDLATDDIDHEVIRTSANNTGAEWEEIDP